MSSKFYINDDISILVTVTILQSFPGFDGLRLVLCSLHSFQRRNIICQLEKKHFHSYVFKIFKQCQGFPANIYLLKFNNKNTRKRCEICSKLTIKTPKQCYWRRPGFFIVNFKHMLHPFVVFLLLTLNMHLFVGFLKSQLWKTNQTSGNLGFMWNISPKKSRLGAD